MTIKELNHRLEVIKDSLAKQNLVNAISLLKDPELNHNDSAIITRIEKIETTYRYLIEYMLTGGRDDQRIEVRDNLISELYELTDQIRRVRYLKESGDIYSETLRNVNYTGKDFIQLIKQYMSDLSIYGLAKESGDNPCDIKKSLERQEDDIFDYIWVSFNDSAISDHSRHLIENSATDSPISYIIINSLILGLLCYYDRKKLDILLDIYSSETSSSRNKARALFGIVLTLQKYGDRIRLQRDLMDRLGLLEDDLLAYRSIRETILAIIKSRDTKRVKEKMEKEVIPELMKLRPDLIKEDVSDFENNPEWEEMFEKSGLNKKMQELNDMMNEGADLMMVTFSNLKQFPFFNSVSHWFIPFDQDNTVLAASSQDKELLSKIMSINGSICDSDKYSLALALAKMPETQKNLMLQQLEAQMDQMNEAIQDLKLKSSTPEFDEELVRSVRDFYRFFNLYRKKTDFRNPFEDKFDFITMPVIGDMMTDEEILNIVGEFYFRRKYYTDALRIFTYMMDSAEMTATLYEKTGFCYQALGLYENARDAYQKAELLKTPTRWLLRNLASVNSRLNEHTEALRYYTLLLQNDPDDENLLLHAGMEAYEIGDPEKALPYFYHVNYQNPENMRAIRYIGRCLIQIGELKKSQRYYEKIQPDDLTAADLLNLGHILLLDNEIRGAIEYYKRSRDKDDHFESYFKEDIEMLEKQGLQPGTGSIILDCIRNFS